MGVVHETRFVPAVPATTKLYAVAVVCDLCGTRCDGADTAENEVEWPDPDNSYAVCRTGVYAEDREVYPEGGAAEVVRFDICPACMRSKVIPWLKAQGAKPNLDQWDW